jgi:BirA family biotin operon repressor/biotin-[acetyl-CoA-carboxylase] ligase
MDVLSAELVTAGLGTRFIGQRVIYFTRHGSTMEAARQEARRGATEGTVLIAGEQTAGKGRGKRVWLSPEGSIALSIVLYPDVSQLPYLIMLASVATARSIEAVTGLEAQLKWPNDILIKGRKICGILIENELKGNGLAWTVIGIGINVNIRTRDLPQIADTATSLYDELGKKLSRVEIIQSLLPEFERLYLSLGDGVKIYREWRQRLVTLGKTVDVISGEEVLQGVAEDAGRDGSLLLKRNDGSISHIVAGDVTLRDAGQHPRRRLTDF